MNIVKELRRRANIQQKELAIIIGVSRPTVSEWESNKKDPSGERLKKLAEYFQVDELVILGKGVVDLTGDAVPDPQPGAPKTREARSLANGIDKMPEEQRKAILSMMARLYPGTFEKGMENNDEA